MTAIVEVDSGADGAGMEEMNSCSDSAVEELEGGAGATMGEFKQSTTSVVGPNAELLLTSLATARRHRWLEAFFTAPSG